jgi:hypothetical protein
MATWNLVLVLKWFWQDLFLEGVTLPKWNLKQDDMIFWSWKLQYVHVMGVLCLGLNQCLGGYLENLDILIGYHFWNPLDINFFDIWGDILISRSQNDENRSYNVQIGFIFFEKLIIRVDIKSLAEYGYEGGLGLGCRL